MADEKKRITAYPEALTLGDDDYVLVDNGGANGTKKFKAKNLGGGASTIEVIMGDLDRTYGTTTDNYIGTLNQWVSIDNGKSFEDYDAIMIVGKPQGSSSISDCIWYDDDIVLVSILKHYDKVYRKAGMRSNTTQYIEYGLDYTNNKFYLANFSYYCPIALLGIKY